MTQGCGSGHTCGCGGATTTTTVPVAQVNGVPLHAAGERLADDELRQRACTELLRQAAQRAGLLPVGDAPGADGATSVAASDAIEALLARELVVPEPDETALQRHYDAHRAQYAHGERVLLRHVLFAVTPGVDVQALRQQAERHLLALRCADPDGPAFAAAARELSNCPSGQQGGELGWLTKTDCAEEFAREVFGRDGGGGSGVLPRLVASRFGLHVVEVRAREAGTVPPLSAVRASVADALRRQAWVTALRQTLQRLASAAVLEGVTLDRADTPLVQ